MVMENGESPNGRLLMMAEKDFLGYRKHDGGNDEKII
jgi:hypothetical protein